jgi:hypothetical protein
MKTQHPIFLQMPHLNELPHTDVYMLDSNLVIGYILDSIPGWKVWVDEHIALGKKLYLLEQTISEVSVKHKVLPNGFEPLRVYLS